MCINHTLAYDVLMYRILILLVATTSTLLGDEPLGGEGQTYNYASQFVNMLLTLGFVLVLIFASVWLLKKIMRSRLQTLNRGNGIKVLERRPLNQKASLYLIDILGQGVVVAESAAGIHLITTFPPEVNVQEMFDALQNEPQPSLGNSLKSFLGKNLKRNSLNA
jgi:flagellar biosynthetic protein FliO